MIVAIITARGGSKGVPGKNIRILNDKPLICYTIEAALQTKIFDRVIVTTDCPEIAQVSVKYGAEVYIRPNELARDDSTSYDVVENLVMTLKEECYEPDVFMLLQPTSPLRRKDDIISAYSIFIKNKYLSLASIVETDTSPFKCFIQGEYGESLLPLFDWNDLTCPRQQLPKTFSVNGAIYICKIKEFLQYESFFVQPFGGYEMEKINSVDIDTELDFELSSLLMAFNLKKVGF